VDVPGVKPATKPVTEITSATIGSLLLHIPPLVADDKITDEPAHMSDVPVIAAGTGLTVIVYVAMQPSQVVNVIVAVPAATPVIVVIEPASIVGTKLTVATAVLLLVHVPQSEDIVRSIVEPAHTTLGPLMEPAAGLTNNIVVPTQPVDAVNEIVTLPTATPVTRPEVEPIDAIVGSLLAHETPLVPLLSVVVEPTHTPEAPVITGDPFTVTTFVPIQPVEPIKLIVVVPAAMPVTTPVLMPTVPTDVLLLIQLPPEVALEVRVVVLPIQIAAVPEIEVNGTETAVEDVAEQPPGTLIVTV
jgi:hypothetical protein